ncbi:MAG: hypothetical protein KC910_00680 [Candidatus Eremiobacteraeota bacterium]|nr:hypothetical protein [Candidatus Eremiobacteraeota bacterium]
MNIAGDPRARFVQFVANRTGQPIEAARTALDQSLELDTELDDGVQDRLELAARSAIERNQAKKAGQPDPGNEFGEKNPLAAAAFEEMLDDVAHITQTTPEPTAVESGGEGIFAIDFEHPEHSYHGTLFVDTTPQHDGVTLYYAKRG